MRQIINYLCFIAISSSQDFQVRVVMKMQFDIPVLGPMNVLYDQTVAPGLLKVEEKIDADRFYASWLADDETGELMISGSEKIIMYDKDDEEYWLQSPEVYFQKPDTSSDNSRSFSYSFSADDEDDKSPPKFTRTGGKEIEFLHGFRTKKWITTISFSEKRMVFEEWFVDKLPLMKMSDSLKFSVKSKFNPNPDTTAFEQFDFSSNLFIKAMDTLTTLDPIDGYAVKINFVAYEESDDPKFTAGFEIMELYAEPVDTGFFVIPENYERIEKD